MDKIFFYISDPLFETVKDSQVINWLQLFGEGGIKFDLILVSPLKYLITKKKLRNSKLQENRSKILGRIYELPILKGRDFTGLSDIIKIFYLAILFVRLQVKGKEIIIQTRNYNNYLPLKILKKLFNIKLIYDLRGASAEEFLYSNNINSIDDVDDDYIFKSYYKILKMQLNMINISDKVYCVSTKLKDYMVNKISNPNVKFSVVPGAADQKTFFFNQLLRKKTREELNFGEQYVICYSGKLDRPWHKGEFIFKLISELIGFNKKFFFLCITPDTKMAYTFKNKYNISDRHYLQKYVKYDQINSYLNAADIGIIIRDDVITNNVASPTKIPEYLMAGLPIIMSDKIGDYSEFVKNENVGIIVRNDIEEIILQIGNIKKDYWDREAISKVGLTYSKQKKLKVLLDFYHGL